jgi:hypothetical protein
MGQRVLFGGDGDVVHAEVGHRQRNPMGVFAEALDVVGG